MSKNYGLIIVPPKPEDYIFGDGKLGDYSINPSGQWDGYLPDYEPQSRPGAFDSFACVTFSILTCVEILERKLFGATSNWSDRFLAKISKTDEIRGNSPAVVAEVLKSKGCVPEKDLPFDMEINSFEKFYATIKESLHTLALAFKAEYSFGYSHVRSNAKDIMEALKYSPVLFTVTAWFKDENGLYYRPQGETDGHAVCCYGYEEGKYWKILDSYADNEGNFLKKVRWDSLPMQCKRFTLNRQIVVESFWQKFLSQLRAILGLNFKDSPLSPITATPPVEVPEDTITATEPLERANKPTLEAFALAIRDFEGKPGDQNYRLNNPGNVRWNPSGYMPMYGEVKKSKNGFAIFSSYEIGWMYLLNMLRGQIHKRPEQTILEFISRYAPVEDGNNPLNYATFIGKRLSVDSRTFKIKNLV